MPLVRLQVRNEHGLAVPDVYRAAKKDDSSAILQGISVASLVGILRQLGDLAEFAADIFSDLHEQVMATAARGHEIMNRVQHLEAVVPSLEKAVLAQTSHIHFAYTAGSDWRADIQTNQNHLSQSDLPQFILDFYEECRSPPCLFLLDKFDAAGAGGCLKRYSDPSLFRIQWASSELKNAEKAQSEKSHKSKRKVRRQRNGEVPDVGLMIRHNSRTHYASLDANEQIYSSESIPISDMRSKSEQTKKIPFFDLKTRTSYMEHVSDVDSYLKPRSVGTDSLSAQQFSDTGPSVILGQQNATGRDVDLPHRLFHRKNAFDSSVTWDEKTEIIIPTIEICDDIAEEHSQALDSLPGSFAPSMLKQKASGLGNFDERDALFDGENRTELCSAGAQSDGISCELDNCVDALNTMESEIKTDSERRIKRNVETLVVSYGSPNRETSPRFSDSESSNSLTPTHLSQIVGIPSCAEKGSGMSPVPLEVLKEPDFKTVTSGPSLGPDVHAGEAISGNSSAKAGEWPPEEASNAASLKLWTNGRLFGVEPLKPPDFSASNGHVTQTPNSDTRSKVPNSVNDTDLIKSCHDDCPGEADTSVQLTDVLNLHPVESVREMGNFVPPAEQSKYSISCQGMGDGEQSVKLDSLNFVSATSTTKLEKSKISEPDNTETKTSVKKPSRESGQNNVEVPFNLFSPNGAQVEAFKPCSIANHGSMKLEERSHPFDQKKCSEPTPKVQLEFGSPRISVCPKFRYVEHPSPPLELMKISFDPINNLEASKLKLEFSNRYHLHESIEDALLPSFHLLHEPMIPLQDIGSETDDDTFYKASSSLSEDLLSHDSESNSEQWETGSNEFPRVSSSTPISSSSELESMTHYLLQPYHEFGIPNVDESMESPQSKRISAVPLLDFPNFDVLSSVSHQKERDDLEPRALLDSTLLDANGIPPPAPPLPPLLWRIMKPSIALVEEKQTIVSITGNQPSDLQVVGSIDCQQFEEGTPKKPPIKPCAADDKNAGWQQLKGLKEPNQFVVGKKLDERDMLLQQIRAKSFSLRRAVTARPNLMPALTTNIKVAAILEKANAIRQAFAGNDDGGDDDDKWSDT